MRCASAAMSVRTIGIRCIDSWSRASLRRASRSSRSYACRLEHRGQRVTLTDTGYCSTCHKETTLKRDPIHIPHERLIARDRWETCLGCHDFHGIHLMKTKTRVRRFRRKRSYAPISPSRLSWG